MGKFIDETGNRYGRLLVLGVVEPRTSPIKFECLCDCGRITHVNGSNLRRGNSKSCGCLGFEHMLKANTTHGHSKGYDRSPTYRIWSGMVGRAGKRKGYLHVQLCDRWHIFENFLADMGPVPDGMSIDRFPDKAGNYEPGNCRWATMSEQQNNRTNNKMVTYLGETKTLSEWCSLLGLEYFLIHARITILGWTPERAFTTEKLGSTLRNLTSFRDPIDA